MSKSTDPVTLMRDYAASRPVVRAVELGEGEYKCTWEFYSEPPKRPQLRWDDLDPATLPEDYVPATPQLSTLPHGMPWEGKLTMRHPAILPSMTRVGNHTADGSGGLSVENDPVAWCMDSYSATEVFPGRMEEVRLFPNTEVLRLVGKPTPTADGQSVRRRNSRMAYGYLICYQVAIIYVATLFVYFVLSWSR